MASREVYQDALYRAFTYDPPSKDELISPPNKGDWFWWNDSADLATTILFQKYADDLHEEVWQEVARITDEEWAPAFHLMVFDDKGNDRVEFGRFFSESQARYAALWTADKQFEEGR